MLNTLPNTPRTTAISPMIAKYSHPMLAETRGVQSETDSAVNIPPRRPAIRTTKLTI